MKHMASPSCSIVRQGEIKTSAMWVEREGPDLTLLQMELFERNARPGLMSDHSFSILPAGHDTPDCSPDPTVIELGLPDEWRILHVWSDRYVFSVLLQRQELEVLDREELPSIIKGKT